MICITTQKTVFIGRHLNNAKAAHTAFKTGEALYTALPGNGIDESASNHAKMCAVFRPIIEGMS
jgi:hypothetical protein